MLIATWVGIGALVVFNLCGWVWNIHRQSKNEARHMGALEQKVADLAERVSAVESILSTHFGTKSD